VMNALCGVSSDEIVTIPMFINLTEAMLISDQTPPLSPDIVIFEILESVRFSEMVVNKIHDLKAQGFRLALDDFIWNEQWATLLNIIDFVKIDVLQHPAEELQQITQSLSGYSCELVAEKVETQQQLDFCKTLGFSYFQGYFLEKPQPIVGKKIRPQLALIMDIYSALQREHITAKELAEQIGRDPQLTFQLLRIINSAAFGLQKKVQNLREAVMLLGMQKLRTWIMIIALANEKSKPAELLHVLLLRARFAELIALHNMPKQSDSAFLVGLFSGLDALLDLPLNDILKKLPLHDDVVDALTHRRGALGDLLKNIMAFEHAQWEGFDAEHQNTTLWQESYFSALKWAREVQTPLRASGGT